jgi:hypothetical protein
MSKRKEEFLLSRIPQLKRTGDVAKVEWILGWWYVSMNTEQYGKGETSITFFLKKEKSKNEV